MGYVIKKEYRGYSKYELEDMLYQQKTQARRDMESNNLELMVENYNLMMSTKLNSYKVEYQKYQEKVADDIEYTRKLFNKLFMNWQK